MFDIPRVCEVLSEILSDKYGCEITITAIPKTELTESSVERCG